MQIDKVREYPYDIVRLHMLQAYERYVLKFTNKLANDLWTGAFGFCNSYEEDEIKPDFVVDASK